MSIFHNFTETLNSGTMKKMTFILGMLSLALVSYSQSAEFQEYIDEARSALYSSGYVSMDEGYMDINSEWVVSSEEFEFKAGTAYLVALIVEDCYYCDPYIAFRDAHEIVGKAVRFGVDNNKDLSEMTLDELKQFSDVIEDDVFEVLTLEGSVAARNHIGGTAPDQVRAAVERMRERLKA